MYNYHKHADSIDLVNAPGRLRDPSGTKAERKGPKVKLSPSQQFHMSNMFRLLKRELVSPLYTNLVHPVQYVHVQKRNFQLNQKKTKTFDDCPGHFFSPPQTGARSLSPIILGTDPEDTEELKLEIQKQKKKKAVRNTWTQYSHYRSKSR